MVRATWNGTVLAKSDDTVVVEGNHYFPREDVDESYLRSSGTVTTCPWKGAANYYHVEVEGERLEDAAWFYAEPTEAAGEIKHRIAFWKGVEVEA